MDNFDRAVREGWAAARRDQPETTVGYFKRLPEERLGDALALFQYASALDHAGYGG